MDHLRKFIEYYKEKKPEQKFPKASDEVFAHLEKELLPHVLKVIQKDNSLFAGETPVYALPDIDFRSLWSKTDEEWKLLQMALMYAVLRGDPKEKFASIFETIKSVLPTGTTQTDEIMKILEDESTQDSLKEILEVVMNTRLATVVGDLVQSLDLSGIEIDPENPEALLEMLRNPSESPALKELSERATMLLEERVRTGKIDRQQLIREIEMLRAKFQSAFGKYLNEAITGSSGNTTGNNYETITGNSPEARRARMMARLQRKLRK